MRAGGIVFPQGFLAHLRAFAHEAHAVAPLLPGWRNLDNIQAHGSAFLVDGFVDHGNDIAGLDKKRH